MASNLSNNLYLNLKDKDHSSIVKVFISNFIKNDFFSDIININLYPSEFSNVLANKGNSVISFIDKFLVDLDKSVVLLKLNNQKQIRKNIELARIILNIRETGPSIITYDNVFKHLTNIDIGQEKLIQDTIDNKITSSTEFKKLTDIIVSNIKIFYEISEISNSIIEFEQFNDYASSSSVSVYDAVKTFRDKVIQIYGDMSKLHSLNKKESEKDYFIIGSKESTNDLANALVSYLEEGYSIFKTGYDFLDEAIEGFESGSVHMISAPSNHGKSIFMSNIADRLIENNLNDFEENDAILIFTLEDDYKKLIRRLCSIFGYYDQGVIKKLYFKGYEILQAAKNKEIDGSVKEKLVKIMNNVLQTSIYKKTQGQVQVIVKHCNEGELSPSDLSKFIDLLNIENINTRGIILDYIDTMTPSMHGSSEKDTYDKQGDITNELRQLARKYNIPVITATQNKREAENMSLAMNNSQVGDSYKKVRYSDYLYMCRMCNHMSVFSEDVRRHVFDDSCFDSKNPNNISPDILKYEDKLVVNLIPFEIKITKAKDGGRDEWRYLLFCKQNLKIYNNVREYLSELPYIVKSTNNLDNDIMLLTDVSAASIVDDILEDDNNTTQDPIDNINNNLESDNVENDVDDTNQLFNIDNYSLVS